MKYIKPKLNIIDMSASAYCAMGTSAKGKGPGGFFCCYKGANVTGMGECNTHGSIANGKYMQCAKGSTNYEGRCSGGSDARVNCSSGTEV
ncbi:MAG TPA: hypothetical protein QF753_16260 [Victivallales bacterium]|nr:hypothetical protein [Victivallales bacterium]